MSTDEATYANTPSSSPDWPPAHLGKANCQSGSLCRIIYDREGGLCPAQTHLIRATGQLDLGLYALFHKVRDIRLHGLNVIPLYLDE